MNQRGSRAILIAACLLHISAGWLCGQTNQIIYSNSLQSGWMDESWATVNLSNTSPRLQGFSKSISVFCTEYAALQLTHTPSSTEFFSDLTFWLNGGASGGQVLTVTGTLDGSDQTLYTLAPLATNEWQQFTIPLSALGVSNQTDFDGIWIWNNNGFTIPTFYVDDIVLLGGLPPPSPPPSTTVLSIYSNALVNGWQDWGWATLNYENTSPVYPGCTDSISVTIPSAWEGIQILHPDMSDAAYASVSFWLNGGASGGQNLQMYGMVDTNGVENTWTTAHHLGSPQANTWTSYTVQLSDLGVANIGNFTGFVIQDAAGMAEPTFYLDDIQLNGIPPLVASAGGNVTNCTGGGATIGGNPAASGGTGGYTYSWTPSTGLSSTTVANPTASPANTTTYTVIITDSSQAAAYDSMTLTVSPNDAATAGAGGNQAITAGSSTSGLGGVVGGGATGGIWTTSGSGTFAPNSTTLNAIYDPSAADVAAGTVTLTLTTTGQLSPCSAATAQAVVRIMSTMMIYSNALVNGWVNSSYGTAVNLSNTSRVYTGCRDSISATIASGYNAFQLAHSPMTNGGYDSISFWLNGGATGGQILQMYGSLATGTQSGRFALNIPPANTWLQYSVPLSALGVADATNFTGFAIQDIAGTPEPAFYLDNIQLSSAAAPAVTQLAVNAGQSIRTADARWFGMNVAMWDSALDTPQSIASLAAMGAQALRWPGGSDSDLYHWVEDQSVGNSYTWPTSQANFIQVITNVNAETMTTVNYGTGTPQEAAAWVAYCNAATNSAVPLGTDQYGINWQTAGFWASLRASAPKATDDGTNFLRISRTAPLGFKYWEIGNEVYGSWETDSNTPPNDPSTYAARAGAYFSLMKEVDPTIKIGVVVTPGANSYPHYADEPAVDPVTKQTNFGWTPILLATLNSRGVTPDFAIHHRYAQSGGGESDAGLLQSSGGWAFDAANLRGMINDYMGTNGTNIELICTENNSVSSNPGKQTVSLVNGLFKMDSLAQLMQTEFNGLFWWNLRNGGDTYGNNVSTSLYGWRPYGDYGVLEGTDLYPTYYTTALMTNFVQAGDTVVSAASDWSLLPVYAVKRQDGCLTVLTINKDPVNTLIGQVSVAGFTPGSEVAVYSYGIPQDDAAEYGAGSPDIAQSALFISSANFNYSFPPYSATVMVLSPPPAELRPLSLMRTTGQFVLQIQGQADISYVLQSSTNLINWTSVSTNTLPGGALNITNTVVPSLPQQYWRVIGQP
jgi:hypothetical protein